MVLFSEKPISNYLFYRSKSMYLLYTSTNTLYTVFLSKGNTQSALDIYYFIIQFQATFFFIYFSRKRKNITPPIIL